MPRLHGSPREGHTVLRLPRGLQGYVDQEVGLLYGLRTPKGEVPIRAMARRSLRTPRGEVPDCAVRGDHGLRTPEGEVPIRAVVGHHDLPTRKGGILWCAMMRPDLPTRKGGVLDLTNVKQLRITTLAGGVWGYFTTD